MKTIKQIISPVIVVFLMMGSFVGNAQANKNNPYDEAGIQHNEIVNEFLKKYGDKKLSIKETLKLTKLICNERGLKGEGLSVEDFYFGMKDIKNNFRGVVNQSSLSKTGKVELQKLFDYMITNGFKGGVSYSEFNKFILNYENSILKSRLSKGDKVFLLKASSVGRHSTYLWYNHFNSSNSTVSAKSDAPRWLRWLIVGAADIAGGVAGGGAFSVLTGAAASTAAITVVESAK